MKRTAGALVALLTTVLMASACSGGDTVADYTTLDNQGTFRMALGSDPGSINPYESTGGLNRQIYAFAYDTLVGRAPSGEAVPQVASSWKVTPKSVTYKLRSDVTCSDGSRLRPSDVAAAFNYIKDPDTLSPWVQFSVPVDYAVRADDHDGTFTITSKTAFGSLLQGAGAVPLVCPSGLKNPQQIQHATAGTGPYTVTKYLQGDRYQLTARKDYRWGPDGVGTDELGMPKRVEISFVANESTMANQLVAGEINAAQITGPDRARLDETRGIKRFDVPVIVGEVNYNEAQGRIFRDTAVRKAATMALNRPELAPVSTARLGSLAKNLIAEAPVQCPGDETTGSLPEYDVDGARRLLDQAGWRPGPDGIRQRNGKPLKIKIIYQTGAPQTESAVELIGQYLKRVGIGTELVGLTNAAFLESLYTTADFDIYYSAINVDFPYMATAFFGGATPADGGRNSGAIDNPEFERLSAKAAAVPAEKSCPHWIAAHKALLSRADVVPVSNGNRPFYTYQAKLQTVGLFAVPTSIRLYR